MNRSKSSRRFGYHCPRSPRTAFTLVELLVVMAIIIVLVSSVLVAGSLLTTRAKTTNTRAVLTLVQSAVEQFEREQKERPTLATIRSGYANRFGLFPPDELEVFTPIGVVNGRAGTRAPSGAEMVPPPPYTPMLFYTRGLALEQQELEHRDLAAMVLAIELFGDESASLLEQIPEKNRSAGVLDAGKNPAQFLDRDGNGNWDPDDKQIRYVLDDWGVPLGYLAQRDWNPTAPAVTGSTNHEAWNEVSTRLIRLNGNQPVIFSYGPDGKDQLTREAMGATAKASLVTDYGVTTPGVVDHVYNADNIYADPALQEKLEKLSP